MPKNRQNPNNPKTKPRLPVVLAVAGVLAYVLAFFSLPSTLGFVSEDQSPLPRWFDLSMLLLWEEMISGLMGNGRFEVGILDRIPIVFAGISWLAIAGCMGRWIVGSAMRPSLVTRVEYLALSVLAGLAILSTVTLIVGLFGGLQSRWFLLSAIATAALICAAVHRVARTKNAAPRDTVTQTHDFQQTSPTGVIGIWASRFVPVATCAMAAAVVLGSLVTPFEFDVVEYHLQAPKEFHSSGSIAFNAHNIYANMPLGAEMHSLAAMTLIGGSEGWWWGGLVGKFVIGCISILAAALVGGFIARYFGNWTGWCAAGLLLSVPGNAFVTMAGLIDSVVGAYILAMTVILTLAWRQPAPRHEVFLASLFAGGAAACKYPGFVFAIVPLVVALVVLNWKSKLDVRAQLRSGVAVAGGLGLTGIPWLAKNWILAGNPFFPLAASIFGGRGLGAQRIEQWNAAHAVPDNGGATYGLASLAQSVKQLWLDSPFLSPTLIPLVACGIAYCFIRKRHSFSREAEDRSDGCLQHWPFAWLTLIVWILAVWWIATHRIDRFWLPVLPLYAALAAVGIAWIGSSVSVTLSSALTILSIAYGGLIAVSGTVGDNRILVSLAELRRDAGDEEHAGRLSPSTLWINQNLSGSDSKILLVGEARVFDFEAPIAYATCFNENPGEPMLKGHSADQQKANLKAAGITHVMIHWAEIGRYRSPGNYGFSDWPQRSDIDELIGQGVVERVAWPFEREMVELLRVLE